jgi:uncharacterized membrane protein YqjE
LSIAVTEGEPATEHRPGLLASLQRLVATVVEILHTRIEIVATDLEEERERLRQMLVLTLFMLFFAWGSLLFLSFFVVVYYWDTARLAAVGGITLLYLGLAVVTAGILWRQLKTRPRLFTTTLSELARDRERLRSTEE